MLSSFNKDHLVKWGVKSNHIISIDVECINWINLFKDYNFGDAQIVCIDTEGYDHVLVENLINETQVRPVIVFEWVNIPNQSLRNIFILLKENNYKFLKFKRYYLHKVRYNYLKSYKYFSNFLISTNILPSLFVSINQTL